MDLMQANLHLPGHELCDAVQGALAEAVSGVYSGWASIGSSPEAYMTAISIGGCSEKAGHASLPCVHQLAAPLYLPADS